MQKTLIPAAVIRFGNFNLHRLEPPLHREVERVAAIERERSARLVRDFADQLDDASLADRLDRLADWIESGAPERGRG